MNSRASLQPVLANHDALAVRASAFPFRSHFTRVGEAALHHTDEGTGPPVMLCHGSPGWSFMFRDAVRTLARRHRCLAVDLPGLGMSTAPPAPGRAFSRNAELFEGFVRAHDLRGIRLVVHATAGPSALAMACRMPERIDALVISNSFAWDLLRVPAMARFVRVVSSRPFAALNVRLNLLPRITTRAGRRTGPLPAMDRAALLAPYRERGARRALQNILVSLRTEAAFFEALEPQLARLRGTPTLLAFGAHDHGYRAGAVDRWRAAFPESVATLLEASAHFPMWDEPERFVGAIEAFLEEVA